VSIFWIVYIVSAVALFAIVSYDAWFTAKELGETVQLKTTAMLVFACLTPYANTALALFCIAYWVYFTSKRKGLWHWK
jgi:hypothetical protein